MSADGGMNTFEDLLNPTNTCFAQVAKFVDSGMSLLITTAEVAEVVKKPY